MNNAISKTLILIICAIVASSQITRGRVDNIDSLLASSSSLPCSNCCTDKTISVGGSAVIQANPDKASLNAQLIASGDTVNQAIDRLATKVNQVINRL